MPHFIREPDIRKVKSKQEVQFFCTAAPKLTKENYRIIVLKINGELDGSTLQDYYTVFLIFTEYMKAHDYSAGVVYILDFSDVHMEAYLASLDPLYLRELINVLIDGYGVRIKGLHLYTPSDSIDTVAGIFKEVVSEKIGGRIFVHKTLKSLYNVVPKENLPEDYGGEEKSIEKQNEEWMRVLSEEHYIEYQKEMNNACTDQVNIS